MSILNPSRLPGSRRAPGMAASLALLLVGALAMPTATVQAAACTQDNQNGCVELSASPAQDTIAVPPNIVLLLDDSGSMNWDYMPDYKYLSDTSIDFGLVSPDVNGVYYKSTTDYTPPPRADGVTRYPNADFGNAWVEGFDPAGTKVDLSTYRGRYEINGASNLGGVRYSYPLPKRTAVSYNRLSSCPSGWGSSGRHAGHCYYTSNGEPPSAHTFSFFDMGNNYAYATPCNDVISDTYDHSTKKCTPGISFFYYTTQNAGGGYNQHFVGHAGTCAQVIVPPGATCNDSAAERQRVANWYSYYHTRILMAKSGLMTAFAGLSANYRFGFGALNNRNSSSLPSPRYTGGATTISEVRRFGDGTGGTIKQEFWKWIETMSPSGGTPLRRALQSAGRYYQTTEAWQTLEGDPNYIAGGTNADELSCRASYTILTTDGFWNGSAPSGVAGATDSDGTVISGPTGNTGQYKAVDPFQGGGVSGDASLADVAAYYWKNDLRTSTANLVPASKRDPAFWQHMATFTMGIGFSPVTKENGPELDIPAIFKWADDGGGPASTHAISGFSWPTPGPSDIENIADMAHAAVVGRGDFFSAKDPQQLAAGFAKAIAQIAERNVAPQPKSANASVAVIGALSFDTGYNTGNWSGTLEAVEMKPDGSRGQVKWDITDILDQRLWSSRKVYTATYTGVDCTKPLAPSGGSFDSGKLFNASVYGSLDCWQAAGLTSPALGGGVDTVDNRINFLLGDDTYEVTKPNGVYHGRAHKLGAIIRSQPVYVSYPTDGYYDNWPVGSPEETAANNGDGYSKFQVDHADREGTVYIGANDGMLHAFAAPAPVCSYADPDNPTCIYAGSGGKERWAFVPRAVYANLGNLTSANFNFRPTVDGTPRTRDVFINGKWTSLLVGGVGLGGRGVYALDITDPGSFNAGKVLWEFDSDMKIATGCYATHGSCRATDLGYTTASPFIGRLHNDKWVVLVPTGYFPDCSQPDVPTNEPEYGTKPLCEAIAAQAPLDANGKPYSALFVLDAQTGTVIAELKTPTNIAGVSSHGLGPAVLGDYESDQLDDVAFAGDLMGNLWRFDLSDANPTKWKVALAYQGMTGSGGKQGVQPITVQPRLFPDPWSSRFMVVFGTGKYLGAGDNSADIPVQSAYGIRETLDYGTGVPITVQRANLKAQTLTEVSGSGDLAGAKLRKLTDDALGPNHKGWYFDFAIPQAKGERVVVTPGAIFTTNGAVFTTMIPTKDNYCDPSTKGAVMLASAGNGGSGSGVSQLGGLGFVGARVTNVATSGSTTLVSKLGGGGVLLPMPIDTGGAGGGGATQPAQLLILDAPVWRRRSWAELDNGQ